VDIALLRFLTTPAVRRKLDVVLGLSLFGYFAYQVWRFRLADFWPLLPRGDSRTIYTYAPRIWDSGYLPAADFHAGVFNVVFPHPPSAVLLFRVLGMAGPEVFTLAWWVLMAAGLIITFRVALQGDRLQRDCSWLAIGFVALLVADNAVAWDLRNSNCNLIYLGLVLAGYALIRDRPVAAGILIGVSFSIKVYSGLLFVWLLFRAPRQALIAAIATAFVLWVVCPVVLLGPAGTVAIYQGWLDQVAVISSAWGYSMPDNPMQPPLVTLRRGAMYLFGAAPFDWQTQIFVAAMLALWCAVLAWYALRGFRPVEVPSRAALADWTVVLLVPLPFSPWLEPYHVVPMVLAAVVCFLTALDDRMAGRDRLVALGALAIYALDRLINPFPEKSLDVFARFVLLVLALAFLRPRLESRTVSTAADASSSQPRPLAA
jgi:hypothetical protein